ncbi:heterodisulfide reductase-related iron-sulfur binding cluster, partial [Campylobacter jejuni]|nr:heterodisulfide reductase-related iron-sulfur binding cluster [Campylobacter jejuni]
KKESSTNPKSFESVVEVLGLKIVPFEKRLDCCGFHASYPAEKSVKKCLVKLSIMQVKIKLIVL